MEDLFNGVSEPSAELLTAVNSAEANRIGLTPQQVGERGERRAARRAGGRGAARGSIDRCARARARRGPVSTRASSARFPIVIAADATRRRRSSALATFTPDRDARRASAREPAADDRASPPT